VACCRLAVLAGFFELPEESFKMQLMRRAYIYVDTAQSPWPNGARRNKLESPRHKNRAEHGV
jgi:hypothetical protein